MFGGIGLMGDIYIRIMVIMDEPMAGYVTAGWKSEK